MSSKIFTIVLALVVASTLTWLNVAKAQYVTDGLISYWSLDAFEADGVTVKDLVGPNDGVASGGPQIVPGKVGNGLALDGVDDWVVCGDDPSLTMKDAFTLEFWVYWEGDMYSPVVTKEGSYKMTIKPSGSTSINFAATGHGWGGWSFGYTATAKTWIHMAAVYDGSNLIAYIDGVEVNRDPATGDMNYKDNPFRIGVYGVPPYCASPGVDCRVTHGTVDEVRLYDRGLSAAEIAQNHAITTTAVSPNKKLAETWGEIKTSR